MTRVVHTARISNAEASDVESEKNKNLKKHENSGLTGVRQRKSFTVP